MGQLVKASDARVGYKGLIEKNRAAFMQALPAHIGVERFLRVAITAGIQNPALTRCTAESIMGALLQSAQLGLVPDGLLGQAFIIPYGDKAQFQVGAQGLAELAVRTGRIAAIIPEVVHEKDEFEWWRDVERDHFKHKPYEGDDDPGAVTHAYCIIRRKDGTASVTVLPKSKIEREHRAHSKAKNSGPWQSHWSAMAKKTAVLVALKWEAKSPELAKVIATEEHLDAGIDIPVGDDEAAKIIEAETIAEPSALDKLAGVAKPMPVAAPPTSAPEVDPAPDSGAPECAGCGKGKPAPLALDAEGRAFHQECLDVLRKSQERRKG